MRLYFEEKGTGQPMLLLHGNGEDSSYFKQQISFFSSRYRVIAVDTRGHGKSPRGTAPFTLEQFADDLKTLCDEMKLTQIILLGFSDGGNIALIFTLKYPRYVKRLILNGANLNPFGVKPLVQLPIVAGYAAAGLCELAEKPGRKRKQPAAGRKAMPDGTRTGTEACNYQGSLRQKKELLGLMVKGPWIRAELLKRIQVPTLVIAGTKDMIRDSHTRKIATFLPKGELKILPGSHFIAAENPEKFNCAVQQFLEEPPESKMKRLWSGRRPRQLDWEKVHHSAVLLPLIRKDGELHVLFEVRAAGLHRQPGEVCFPGGAVEPGETKRQAAVRETMEELLIDRSQIELLAPMDVLVTQRGVTVWPFLALIKNYQGTFSREEVDHTFTVPLSWLLKREPEHYKTTVLTVPGEDFPFELVPGGREYHWGRGYYDVFFYQNENAVIWGMTAKILYSFIKLYREEILERV